MNKADFALINGNLRTGEKDTPYAEAIAVYRGKIVFVGSTEEVRTQCDKNTIVFDAENKLVLPGFIDGHVHFLMGGFSLIETDLTGTSSRGEFLNKIKEQHANLTPDAWLTGIGWDHSRWSPTELPQKSWLDSEIPDRPVYVIRQDMHMAFANSRALKLAGIDSSTPDPDGGVIDRDPSNNLPTGILRDAAMRLIENVIPEPDNASYRRAIEKACFECSRFGITGVHDITAMKHIPHLEKASKSDLFTVRMFSRPPLREWKKIQKISQSLKSDPELFRIGGLKAFTDGSLGSSTALFIDPYTDDPDEYGVPNDIMFPEGNLLRLALEADKQGFNLSIHAIGDMANRQVLAIYRQIEKKNGKRDRRWRVEHAQHVQKEDFVRFRDLDVISSMQPYHCIDDARWCEIRIGKERCETSYAIKTFADLEVALVFGSDWTVAPLDPLTGIDAAVNRIPVGGKKSWHPEQRISVEEAVKAYTTNPAYAAFEETGKGSIAPGKLADFVVLSDNIFEIAPEEIKNAGVEATIFGGKVVYTKE